MAYFKGLSHGLMVGVVLGVMVAPRRGSETRAAIELSYRRTRRTAERAVAGTQAAWQTAQPAIAVAGRAAGVAGRMVQPVVHTAGARLAQRNTRLDRNHGSSAYFKDVAAGGEVG